MEDFSTIHDGILKFITPPTNFSNEPLSSTVFIGLFLLACVLFIGSHLLPWRLFSLVVCWLAVTLGHPSVQQMVLDSREHHLRPYERNALTWFDSWVAHDIVLDAPPETREVEVFELQCRKGFLSAEWESWMFSPNPYDPLSPQRIIGERPKGTRFFEDVVAPRGWEWGDKKWVLDLGSKEWVEERMVQGVEVEVEGERWVSDLVLEDTDISRRGKQEGKLERVERSLERRIGEWRRRRWIRMVKRKVVERGPDTAG
ncbi:MAG: hypothetical protein LQ342_001962 [Letrouitia transgressa]|nr:MAG: hypothetical protein LQ342_001962 [Letrouitia transgressa]